MFRYEVSPQAHDHRFNYSRPRLIDPITINVSPTQVQKRKLLWGNKKESKEEPKTTCLGTWKGAKFDDNKQSEKFRKLMGMKGTAAEEAGEGT